LIAELPIKLQIRQSTVAHGSNSSYYRGWDEEDHGPKVANHLY
jgi:hypothetical protein